MRRPVRRSLRSALALGVLVAGCGCDELPPPKTVAAASDEEEARGALFRRLHEQAVQAAPDVRVSCLRVENGNEPTTRLLRLLSGKGLSISQASRCVPSDGRIVDAISGLKATVLSIGSFTMTPSGTVEAFAIYGLGPLWCGGGTYSLEFHLGRWEVDDPATPIVC